MELPRLVLSPLWWIRRVPPNPAPTTLRIPEWSNSNPPAGKEIESVPPGDSAIDCVIQNPKSKKRIDKGLICDDMC